MNKPCSHPCCPSTHCRRPKKDRIRKPIKRKAYKISKVSKGRAKLNRKYAKKRRELLKKEGNQVCAISQMEKTPEIIEHFKDCMYHTADYHHPEGRDEEHLLPTDDGKFLCRNCHNVVETHPELAKRIGLSKTRFKPNYRRSA